MTYWAEDPNLFLHKGKDGVVHVLRCKKETTTLPKKETITLSPSSMLMTPKDFIDEGEVTNHLSLYGGVYDWEKNKYEALIDYIYSKHLMVNCHGFVIVELAIDDYQKTDSPRASGFLHRKKKAVATPVQLIYIRALDILDMVPYGSHPHRAVPSRTAKYLQNGTVVQTEPNLNEIKLTEEMALKSKELENFQQEMLTKEKTEMEILIKRVVELEAESANNKNTRSITEVPLPVFRIYTKADTQYSLTIQNGEQVIFRPNDASDDCQYWMKDDKYGASLKDVCGYPSYALVNKFTGQALKPSSAATEPVELVRYNPNVPDESILWSEVDLGDGYTTIRKATDPSLNLAASLETGGIGDGTTVHLWTWGAGDNQKWKMIPFVLL